MKVQSTELISRYTQSTNRNLLIVCGAIILVEHYGLNSSAWEFAGNKEISPEQLREISLIAALFLFLSHLVSWYSDWIAYKKWFRSNKSPVNDIFSMGQFGKNEADFLNFLVGKLNGLKKQFTEYQGGASNVFETHEPLRPGDISSLKAEIEKWNEKISGLESTLEAVREMLRDVGVNFRSLSRTSNFVIFVWYLSVPVLVFLATVGYLIL